MRLDEAYDRLSLSLDFEEGQPNPHPGERQPRRIGTTTHMLIELYLDMAEVENDLSAVNQRPAQFVLACFNEGVQRHIAGELQRIHQTLNLNVRLDRLHYGIPQSKSFERMRGQTIYSWAVFCDHTVKDNAFRRIEFPFFQTRSLALQDGLWAAFSRDGELLGHLTETKAKAVMDAATAPITYRRTDDVPELTYPAWENPEVLQMVRFKKAFER